MKAGTNLEKVLASGKFAVTAEVGPPKGAGASVVLKKGARFTFTLPKAQQSQTRNKEEMSSHESRN